MDLLLNRFFTDTYKHNLRRIKSVNVGLYPSIEIMLRRHPMGIKKSHTGHRSSKTGRFVKEDYAKKHPSTTQKESIPNPGRGDTGRGKNKK